MQIEDQTPLCIRGGLLQAMTEHRKWASSGGQTGRRFHTYGESVRDVDFKGQYLSSAEFRMSDARGANFSRSNITFGLFHYADLRGADFKGAVARHANFQYADLRDADFRGADLSHANFSFADLRGANFSGSTLEGTGIYVWRMFGLQWIVTSTHLYIGKFRREIRTCR